MVPGALSCAAGPLGGGHVEVERDGGEAEPPASDHGAGPVGQETQAGVGRLSLADQPVGVGEGAEGGGVEQDHPAPFGLPRGHLPAHGLRLEEPKLQPLQRALVSVSEGGTGAEPLRRFGQHPAPENAPEGARDRGLAGGGGSLDGDHSTSEHGHRTAASGKKPTVVAREVKEGRRGRGGMPEHPAPARHRFGVRVLEVRSAGDLAREIQRTASDPEGVGIMTRKGRLYPVWLDRVSLKASPLLKQEALAVGADTAHARGIADHSVAESGVVVLATLGQYRRLIPKLRRQPFHLAQAADEIELALAHYLRRGPRTVPGAHRTLALGDRPRVMGVVNVTPDSFSDGGRFFEPSDAIARARELAHEGADVIDIGGESTRPGALPLDPEEEWRRIAPVLEALTGQLSVPLSVDTRHAEVARRAVAKGADIVNDVSGLRDPEMRRVVRESGAGAVVMHMRGTPETMQADTQYADLRAEVFGALAAATDRAIEEGIPAERLIVDPGLGFGKTPEQSLELLLHAGELRSLGYPVMVGASRKSFLGWATGGTPTETRGEAGLAAAVLAGMQGVDLVRVHEVGPTVRALALVARAQAMEHAHPAPPAGDAEWDG